MQGNLIEASRHHDWKNRVENWDNFEADRAHTARVLAAEKACKSVWTDVEKAGVTVRVEYDAEAEVAYIAESNKQAKAAMVILRQEMHEAAVKIAVRKALVRRWLIIAGLCLGLIVLKILIVR